MTLALHEREMMANAIPEPNSGCWLWTSAMGEAGYGYAYIKGEPRKQAHRYIWELKHGPISDGKFLCHKCDVRCCVNPDHLWAGYQIENVHDMDDKGRRRCRSNCCYRRLTDDEIRSIYTRSDLTIAALAETYSTSLVVIRDIRKGKGYRRVTKNLVLGRRLFNGKNFPTIPDLKTCQTMKANRKWAL